MVERMNINYLDSVFKKNMITSVATAGICAAAVAAVPDLIVPAALGITYSIFKGFGKNKEKDDSGDVHSNMGGIGGGSHNSGKQPGNSRNLMMFLKKHNNGINYSYAIINFMNFGGLNDKFGCDVGGYTVGNMLDILEAEISGDEYLGYNNSNRFILMLNTTNTDLVKSRLSHMIEKLSMTEISDGEMQYYYNCNFNCGVYVIKNEPENIEIINTKASMALHSAQKGQVEFFTIKMNEKLKLRETIFTDAERAINEREFIPYFQPKYDIDTMSIAGAEILARWMHPSIGLISPADFIPVLELNGSIIKLDLYMIEEACKMVKSWIEQELMPVTMSVNISEKNIAASGFLERITSITDSYNVPPSLIELEFEEATLISADNKTIEEIIKLSSTGFRIAVDNFGSSGLQISILAKMPIDVIKIDRKLISDASANPKFKTGIRAIVNMASELGIEVMAGGVENNAHKKVLEETKINCAQGYIYSKPMDLQEFEKLIF